MVKNFEVSSHFMINRQGLIFQYVSTDLRAWHAGRSVLNVPCANAAGEMIFEMRENCNDFSIGIELEGDDFSAFTTHQYQSLKRLMTALKKAYPLQYCTAHSHIAPERKTDPGPYFDWSILETQLQDLNLLYLY
jgi:AmpD protein